MYSHGSKSKKDKMIYCAPLAPSPPFPPHPPNRDTNKFEYRHSLLPLKVRMPSPFCACTCHGLPPLCPPDQRLSNPAAMWCPTCEPFQLPCGWGCHGVWCVWCVGSRLCALPPSLVGLRHSPHGPQFLWEESKAQRALKEAQLEK